MEKPIKGLVLAIGSGLRDKKGRIRPLDVQVGDFVLFGKYAGSEVTIDGNEMLVLKEEDIFPKKPPDLINFNFLLKLPLPRSSDSAFRT